MLRFQIGAVVVCCLSTVFAVPRASAAEGSGKSRSFEFTYEALVTGLPSGKTARIWLPVPATNEDQEVEIVARHLPADARFTKEAKYGNRIVYAEAKGDESGNARLSLTYRVKRHEVKGDASSSAGDDAAAAGFLAPDKMVPINGRPLDLIKNKQLPTDQIASSRVLYDVVNGHMRYSKEGAGWGRGDSVWACDSGFGNCTDFHSLFISLARSQKIPAKFEIGFSIPEKRGGGDIAGYHCWAKFRPAGKGWIPVDISEANKNPKMRDYYFGNLTEDRVTFSTGRDLQLEPPQDGPAVNFLIYPYVEVAGASYPAEKIKRKFSFKDIPSK